MISKDFITGQEYQQFKEILLNEIQFKPITLKTSGKSNEVIAREVEGYAKACMIIKKAITAFERKASSGLIDKQRYI